MTSKPHFIGAILLIGNLTGCFSSKSIPTNPPVPYPPASQGDAPTPDVSPPPQAAEGRADSPSLHRGGEQVVNAEPSPQPEPPEYSRREVRSLYGVAEEFTISTKAFERQRAVASERQARLLKTGVEQGIHAYVIDSPDAVNGSVIVEPRVYLQAAFSGGTVQFREGAEGGVAIDVGIALADGLSKDVATGRGSQALPAEFVLKNRDMFLKQLTQELSYAPTFLASVPCPEKLTIKTNSKLEFEVALRNPLKNCPLNTLLPAVLRLSRGDWEKIALALVEDNSLDLAVDLNFSLPVVIEYANAKLSREVVLRALEKEVNGQGELFSQDKISTIIDKLAFTLLGSFALDFSQEELAPLRDKILNDYFTSVDSDQCTKDAGICFGRRGEWSTPQVGDYAVTLKKQRYFGKPVTIHSTSKVSDSLGDRQEILISAPNENPLVPPKAGELSQVFRTVHEGEVMELKFREIGFGEVSFEDSHEVYVPGLECTDRYSSCLDGRWSCTNPSSEDFNCRNECSAGFKPVCIRSHQQCSRHECIWPKASYQGGSSVLFRPLACSCADYETICDETQSQCQGWSSVCDRRRVCDRLPVPDQPVLPYRTGGASPEAPDFSWTCGSYAQNQCAPGAWVDHWKKIRMWSLPVLVPHLKQRAFKAEYWDQVISGLSLRFSWASPSGTETKVCALKDFEKRMLPPDRLLIVLKNTANCTAFNENNRKAGHAPMLGFVNQIVFPAQFQCGVRWDNWKGERSYSCKLPDEAETVVATTVAEDEQRLARGERIGIYKSYFPRVELQGRLRIVGSKLESLGGGND